MFVLRIIQTQTIHSIPYRSLSFLIMSISKKHQLSEFHDHPFQEIMALFLMQQNMCKDAEQYPNKKQYFFEEFYKFLKQYYNLDHYQDATMYFASSLSKDKKGAFNAAGGCGRISHASKKEFISKYRRIESAREDAIDEFAAKYCATFDVAGQEDPRLFVGVKEVWRKLDNAGEIVAASKWSTVASRSYNDETFQAPIPKDLDKSLVPLSIRTKVTQLHQKQMRSARPPIRRRQIDPDEEEEIYNQITSEAKISTTATPAFTFVPPPEMDDW